MLQAGQFRQILIADMAVAMEVVKAHDAAAALARYWDRRDESAVSLADELIRIADLAPDALVPVEQEVDRLISEAGGDARAALTRHGGLDRSIHVALSGTAAPVSMALTEVGAGARAPLATVRTDRYIDFMPAGEGGMGLVYMALDTELNRTVAFKMVRPDAGSGARGDTPTTPVDLVSPERDTPASRAFAELKARFLQEAWVTGGLEHPGIVPVYELGQTKTGIPYYTMRFVRGQRTLKDALDEVREAPVEDRLKLIEPFLKLCDTVRYAHSRGVIHRDLKPVNVALGEFGEVVLLDWGLARLEGRDDMAASRWQERVQEFREAADLHTVAGALGTPGYMAPEAAMGRIEQVDARSDVYSLGVVLFEILTGCVPFEFRSYAEYLDCMAHKEAPEAAEKNRAVPERLSKLCKVCLSRDRAQRPDDVRSLSGAIRAWQAASAIEREVQGHLRDARAALEAAEAATAAGRLRQVDRAAAALQQAEARQPDNPAVRLEKQRATTLRETGLRERERASGRRLLARVGVVALVLATAAGFMIAAVLAAERTKTERALEQARKERDEKGVALAAEATALAEAKRERDEKGRALAQVEKERAEKASALDDVFRLADGRMLRELEEEAVTLSPLHANLLTRTGDWTSRAGALLMRMPEHESALERLRKRIAAEKPGNRRRGQALAEWQALLWQHEVLTDLIAGFDALANGTAADRMERLRRSAKAASDPAWTPAIERIAANPKYDGLRLKPQVGLVPLGPDPDSGLEEFAHVLSGAVPARDQRTRRLAYQDDSAIVLVLIPGGTFWMGAQKEDPDKPNHEPKVFYLEAPVREVTLSPYFIAKHECTQAQWAALTNGQQPARFVGGNEAARLPVEQVSALDCDQALPAAGLLLPTEAQWEHACRAGTGTPWWVGASEDDLVRVAWYENNTKGSTRPVGAKPANALGLHDVHGNVREWCQDRWGPYQPGPATDPLGPGIATGMRVLRGGSWEYNAWGARSAIRHMDAPESREDDVGVRPARSVTTK